MLPPDAEEEILLKKPVQTKIGFFLLFTLIGFVGGYLFHENQYRPPIQIGSSKIEVCFTPGSLCENKIIQKINSAKKEILLQAFAFTSKPLAQALLRAVNRGVVIKVLSDKGQYHKKYSVLPLLKSSSVPIYFDKQPSYAHNKVMIIDGILTITGSYNWTYSAQHRNSENLVFIESSEVAERYSQNFYSLLRKAS